MGTHPGVVNQRGFTLVEAAVSVALAAVVAGGCVAAFAAAAKWSAPDPAQQAAEMTLARVVNVGRALSKYDGTLNLSPAPWTLGVPHPGGTPIPLTVTAEQTSSSAGPIFTVSVAYDGRAGAASLVRSVPLVQLAPAPGSSIVRAAADPRATPAL
ncbi:MAG: prepilin-type N-terminal cleavage/methylation domain-containing protein [Candidatus Eremiobacteraeota bacterium]|nr:prepilin-type N-terminal cleavage/methylation domain-containing protein [Candidatus Eremiobacteraeota bacterium]